MVAIVPNLELEQSKGMKLQRVRFAGNEKVEKTDQNTMESLANLMNAIYPYKVTTFFSFQSGEETTFSAMASTGVEKYKEKCAMLMKRGIQRVCSALYPERDSDSEG